MRGLMIVALVSVSGIAWGQDQGALFTEPAVEAAPKEASRGVLLSDRFRLHSQPGARRVLYLDFDGQLVVNTRWNLELNRGRALGCAPYGIDDGSGSGFSAAELERIHGIWARVAEQVGPGIDVTTEEPSPADLVYSGPDDPCWGVRVIVTRTTWYGGVGAVGYEPGGAQTSETPCFVFSDRLAGGAERAVAEVIAKAGQRALAPLSPFPSAIGARVLEITLDAKQDASGLVWAEGRVRIEDLAGQPVENAEVHASWSGSMRETLVSARTNAKGDAVFKSPGLQGGGTFVLTVKDVRHPDVFYAPRMNVETSDAIAFNELAVTAEGDSRGELPAPRYEDGKLYFAYWLRLEGNGDQPDIWVVAWMSAPSRGPMGSAVPNE